MNPLYAMYHKENSSYPQTKSQNNFNNSFWGRMQIAQEAMRNPAGFVRQQFPDIPEQIANDPNQILQYLQKTRHIPTEQLNFIMNQFARR